MKPIYLLFFIASFCPIASFGQYFTVDTIKGESPYHQMVDFIFPNLKSATNQDVATIINNELIRDVLKIEPGTQKLSIFENIWGKKALDIPNVGNISFKVINNDADFFCIGISATTCEPLRCEDWTRYYIRESSTGKPVVLADLISAEGIKAIYDSVQVYKTKRIQDYIDRLKDALDNKPLSDDDMANYKTAIDLYDKYMKTLDKTQKYSLNKKQLTVHIENILPKNMHYMDKVDYDFPIDLSTLHAYMTDYAKTLLKQ